MSVHHLYLHIPFCHRICPYCAFYKHQPGHEGMAPLVDSLLLELERQEAGLRVVPKTIYFGGGTPTLLAKPLLGKLLDGLRVRLDLSLLEEWTVEANPMTFDAEKVEMMRAAGITRVSLGVQSWQPRFLDILGRDHSPEGAERSYQLLADGGFDVINIDLMFSLPGQQLLDWRRDLEKTASLEPDHISAYNLTYEEDTDFFRKLGSDDFQDEEERNADLFYEADHFLRNSGFSHYETSNYARPGLECQHNRAYWDGRDYLSLGPSAVSTVEGRRWKNLSDTAEYVRLIRDGETVEEEVEWLGMKARHNERVALLLRTLSGLPTEMLDPSLCSRARELLEEGLLEVVDDRYRLPRSHWALVDPVAAELTL